MPDYEVKSNKSLFEDWKKVDTIFEDLRLQLQNVRSLVQNDMVISDEDIKCSRDIAFHCYQDLDRLKAKIKKLTEFTLNYVRSNPVEKQ